MGGLFINLKIEIMNKMIITKRIIVAIISVIVGGYIGKLLTGNYMFVQVFIGVFLMNLYLIFFEKSN